MVKRTITITTIVLILSMIVSLIIVLNKSSFAADGDIASGTSGTCSWVIDSEGVLTISPTDGVSGTLNDNDFRGHYYSSLWSKNGIRAQIKKVVVEDGVKTGQSCLDMFYGLYSCKEMDLSGLDTSNAKTMEGMFIQCSGLSTLDLSNFDTSNVTNMRNMFNNCTKLTTLNINSFNTEKVTDMSSMFYYCSNLASIDLSNLNTEKVTTMNGMFNACTSLTSIDVSTFNTGNVTNMSEMFSVCSKLESIDISNWDTSKVTDMEEMFSRCIGLTSINLGTINTSSVTNMKKMFSNVSKLASIDLSGINTEKVTDMSYMFELCTKLKSINLDGLDTSNVTTMSNMFERCETIETIDVSSFNTQNNRSFRSTFSGCKNLSTLDVSKFNTSNVIDFTGMFSSCEKIQTIDVSGFDTSNATGFEGMFSSCYGLESLDVSNFDTKKATSMEFMFSNCRKVQVIDVSNFDTSNVTNMGAMFATCYKITSIDVSGFDTSKVTDMDFMFSMCTGLKSIDLSSFDTSKVTDMEAMFQEYKGKELDVSGFDTSNVTDMSYMFSLCSNISTLDLSGFDTSKVTSMHHMFQGCRKLTTLDLSNFNTSKVGNMDCFFTNCISLDSVDLGENFSFDGKGSISNKALLPTPSESKYTGKWIREDKAFGPYTAEELRDNYDNSTMAGKWIRERNPLTVKYSYEGIVPNGASKLPDEKEYSVGEQVTVAPNATAPGYTFSGWNRTGTFNMPDEMVNITGYFTPNEDTPYKVEHYLEDLNGNSYSLGKVDNLKGETNTEVRAKSKSFEGFRVDRTIQGTIETGNIEVDGSLVLKLYYKRKSYNVTYKYTGDVPENASSLPQSETYKYGEEIKVPEDATAEGYTFSGWIKDYITMPAQDIEITGNFISKQKDYSYKVEYYFDGEIDESLEEILKAQVDEEINLTPQTPVKHGEKNYTLVSNNHNIVVSVNDEDNIIRVYYETDVLDYAIDNFEDTTEGDGIPDKYQIRITYKVENGNWNDGTKGTKTDVITLKDKDGNLSEDGTGITSVPEVGQKANEGYEVGAWNEDIPSQVSREDDGKVFVYSYKKTEAMKTDITEATGKIYNPKTDDMMHNYLLIGIGGMLVLVVVNKLRRKYSRKAKKIQY